MEKNIKEIFENRAEEYDGWYERHRFAYLSEVEAFRKAMEEEGVSGEGLEVGVGTGRFAVPLGIKVGVEPVRAMARIAEARGVRVVEGVAERLPFEDERFDFVVMCVTVCFVDDPLRALKEAARVLKPGGSLLLGIVDRNSPLGRVYQAKKDESPFYRQARFFSTDEIVELMNRAGFEEVGTYQTLFTTEISDMREVDRVEKGSGEGGFVVIVGRKSQ